MTSYKIFNSYADQIIDANQFRGLPLYRFFKEPWQAEALLDGKVWIGTLKNCREFECPQQGDRDEGTSTFHQQKLLINNRIVTKEDHLIMNHMPIKGFLPPAGEFYKGCIDLSNNIVKKNIPNGFLLCTTNAPADLQSQSTEWNHGVEITLRQSKFFKLLMTAMIRQGIPIINYRHAWANYSVSRLYSDVNNAPQNLAFIKPDRHKAQSEYRFFWEAPKNYDYPKEGILIDCPEIKPYLKKM